MKIFLAFFLLLLGSENNLVRADGVLGCGGFVKSDVDINFSLVEVKLYTPHGSIKYQTDCAPNTGYYLIPLYDKGDFILKVEPPKGWSFEPTSIELHVDGTTDKCSLGEDINFKFIGFSVSGKVISKGQIDGPTGVSVSLVAVDSGKVLQNVATDEGGSYAFSHVLPGDYDVTAFHPVWKMETAKTRINVVSDNGNAGNSIVVSGYDVNGKVLSDGDPIQGVNFILFSTNVKAQDVSGCDKAALKGFTNTESVSPICRVTSKDSGDFSFPSLPPGKYFIVPFFKGEHITFDVVPSKMEFEVKHQSVTLETSFQVAGFSVSGRVFDIPKGSGISQAKVFINGRKQTTTSQDGTYHLENMKTGTYQLSVIAEDIFFTDVSVKITPNTPHLPDIVASSFSMCGKIIIDRIPEGLGQVPTQRRVIYYPEGKGSEAVSITTETDGTFCSQVKPGKYVVKIHLSDHEVKAGLRLTPSERVVMVSNKPVMDVAFSQFQAQVSGTVTCMEKCGKIDVVLDSVGRSDSKQVVQVKEAPKGATFTFETVLPGKYKASILHDSWCWKEKTLELEVTEKDFTGLDFIQTGYILKCSISHIITLNFAHEKKSGSVGSFQLNKGTNRFCLAQPGVYRLTPDSCHKFEKDVYTYDTSNPSMLTLTAIQHLAHGTIEAEKKVGDIVVTIKSSVEDAPTVIGPLKANQDASDKDGKQQQQKPSGPFTYSFSHWARSGEKLQIVVKSKEMLFYPPQIETTVFGDACPGEVAKFVGKKGVFIAGIVKPGLEGVDITVKATDNTMEPILLKTDTAGKFRVGPLHNYLDYEVSAEKDGYVLTKEAGQQATFRAFKLGQILVVVLAENKVPLSDVLLSLSGGNQYRSNNVTGDSGTMVFTALSPGQYFLRPMMKEYRFEPVSQMIDVQEGTTIKIMMKGSRVAYSCYGRVTSLNGEPEQGIIMEAVGQDTCSTYQEESKTDHDGFYRIRGLEPKCMYEVRLKTEEVNTHIERAAPKSRLLMVQNKDFVDINIIAFRRMNLMDISGNVIVPHEHLSSLKVRLFREDAPDSPVHTVSLSVTSFFYMPSVQIDDKKYTLRLDSSLLKQSYDFSLPEVAFTANTTYQHFTLKFEPKRKSLEQELSRGSFLILPLTLAIIYLAYNYQKVFPVVQQSLGQVQEMINKQQYDKLPVPQEPVIAEPIQVKKKIKPRKT